MVYTPRLVYRWFDLLVVVVREWMGGGMVKIHSCEDLYNGTDDGNCPINPPLYDRNKNDRGALHGIHSVTTSSCPTDLRSTHIYEFSAQTLPLFI